MTLTPENAPAPEQVTQSAPTGQTAMQQPLTAPDVSSPAGQPTPAIANNNAASQAACDYSAVAGYAAVARPR